MNSRSCVNWWEERSLKSVLPSILYHIRFGTLATAYWLDPGGGFGSFGKSSQRCALIVVKDIVANATSVKLVDLEGRRGILWEVDIKDLRFWYVHTSLQHFFYDEVSGALNHGMPSELRYALRNTAR